MSSNNHLFFFAFLLLHSCIVHIHKVARKMTLRVRRVIKSLLARQPATQFPVHSPSRRKLLLALHNRLPRLHDIHRHICNNIKCISTSKVFIVSYVSKAIQICMQHFIRLLLRLKTCTVVKEEVKTMLRVCQFRGTLYFI